MAEWTWTEEQIAALALDGKGKLVLAGAGSGKTTVLAERYVRLLAPNGVGGQPLEPRQIVAMTFSRKAAVNLQAKIHKTLLTRQQSDPDNAIHWHRQRERMPWARIGTIHSICGAMLGMFPVEAGVDPGFTIGERIRERSARVEARLRDLVWKRDPDLRVLLGAVGTLEGVHGLVETLLARPDIVEAIREAKASPTAAAEQLDEAQRQGMQAFDLGESSADHSGYVELLLHLLAVAEPLLPSGEEPVRELLYDDIEFHTLRMLRRGGEAATAIKQSIHHLLVDEFQDTSARQWDLIRELVRSDSGDVDHSHLFLVGDDKQSIYGFRSADVTVVEAARRSFAATGDPESSWLVELSDNYRTQAGLLAPLNEAFSKMLPRAGDDVRPFEALARPLKPKRETHPEAPAHFELALGFELSSEEVYRQLAERLAAEVGSLQIVDPGDRAGEKTRPLEMEDVGVLFRTRTQMGLFETALRNAGLPYRVVKGRGFLQRQEVRDLVHFLKALSDPRDEIALIGFLRSPLLGLSDAAVAALKLDEGGDLWRTWRRYGEGDGAGSAWWEALSDDDREAITTGWGLWRKWLRMVEHRGPVDVLLDVLQARGALAAYTVGTQGAQREANLYRMIDLVREFTADGSYTLRRLVERLESELESPDEENEKEAEVDARSGITLMTIHAAKGLEFPYVVLPNLESEQKKSSLRDLQRGNLFLGDESLALADPSLGVLVKEGEGLLHHAMKDHFAPAEEAAERLRLIYVAATRARDRLLLVSRVQAKTTQKDGRKVDLAKTSHLHQWAQALGVELTPDGVAADDCLEGVEVTQMVEGAGYEGGAKSGKHQENKQNVSVISIHPPRPPDRWMLPFTAFAEWLADPSPEATMNLVWFAGEVSEEDDERPAADAAGREEALWLGDAVHRLYQRFGPGASWAEATSGFEEFLEGARFEGGDLTRIRGRAEELFRGGEAAKSLGIPANASRELAVRLRLGDLTLRGQVDLSWRDDTGVHVLDYKTNTLQGGVGAEETTRSHGYDHQIRLYCLALMQAWGAESATGQLLFLDGGAVVTESVKPEEISEYHEKVNELKKMWRMLTVKKSMV